MTTSSWLIIGLANPGKSYASTRHNVGAWWMQAFCQNHGISLKNNNKLHAEVATANINQQKVICAIPTTYMNNSGKAVQALAAYYQIPPQAILIIHDELDLKPGVARFKLGGGHGGHNGLRDIMPQLKKADFHRLRLGIGHPGDKRLVADFVLAQPSKTDHGLITQAIDDSLNAIPYFLSGDTATAMQTLHSASRNH